MNVNVRSCIFCDENEVERRESSEKKKKIGNGRVGRMKLKKIISQPS